MIFFVSIIAPSRASLGYLLHTRRERHRKTCPVQESDKEFLENVSKTVDKQQSFIENFSNNAPQLDPELVSFKFLRLIYGSPINTRDCLRTGFDLFTYIVHTNP